MRRRLLEEKCVRTYGCSDPAAEGEIDSNHLTGQSILLQPVFLRKHSVCQNVHRCTLSCFV